MKRSQVIQNPGMKWSGAMVLMLTLLSTACGGYDDVAGDFSSRFSQTTLSLRLNVAPTDEALLPPDGDVAYLVTGERVDSAASDCPEAQVSRCVRPDENGELQVSGLCNGRWNLRLAVVDTAQSACDDGTDDPTAAAAPAAAARAAAAPISTVASCYDGETSEYPVTMHAGSNALSARCSLRASSVTFLVNLQ